MKGLDDHEDGLNDEAFDRALGIKRNRASKATVVTGLRDGDTANTGYLMRQIVAAGATAVVAKTGRVTLTTSSGERRVYALNLDTTGDPAKADSPLTRALRDLDS